MCNQDEKKQGNEVGESVHVNSINAVWPKRITKHILPHAGVRGQKMLQLRLLAHGFAIQCVIDVLQEFNDSPTGRVIVQQFP